MRSYAFLLGLTLIGASSLRAQQLSGEGSCSMSDTAHTISVADRPDHLFVISRSKCTWTKPFEIAGAQSKGGTAVQFDEVRGNTASFHGVFLDIMSNGDTVRYRYEGTSRSKDGRPQSAEWNWVYAGGTGKMANLKGKGSCKGGWDRQGKNSWRCTGQYRL
jgi:hypothetical protein